VDVRQRFQAALSNGGSACLELHDIRAARLERHDMARHSRHATTGGLTPPAATCNATTAATQAEVPYTADYYFWK
jgi:hypothetical protein